MQEPVRLEIIIVGGGIAGFAAAAGLRRTGHQITLVEKSSFKREVGYMFALGTNACRVLDSLGFDFDRSGAVESNTIEAYHGFTLERMSYLDAQVHAKTEREKSRTIYRPDLHAELVRLALAPSDIYPIPYILLGSKAIAVDVESGTVKLENGTTLSGDLIIGADGERSIVKAAYDEPDYLLQAQFRVLRAIIPTKVLEDDPATRSLLVWQRKNWTVFVGEDDFHTIAWFEGRNGELQDLEAGYLSPDAQPESDPIKAREKLLDIFGGFHPDIVKVLQKTTTVTDWPITYSKPLPYLHKRKSLLIGDAAHSMFPTSGQGGCQALEDIACLYILLSSLPSKSALQNRLQLYSAIRKPRTRMVQWLSPLRPGQEEDLRKKMPGHSIHKTGIRTGKEHVDFLYGYDIFEETRRALRRDEQLEAALESKL